VIVTESGVAKQRVGRKVTVYPGLVGNTAYPVAAGVPVDIATGEDEAATSRAINSFT